jgi:hypothetical protein
MLTTIGKKEIKATTIIFVNIPYPTHTNKSGVMAIIGIVCDVIMSG